MSTTSLLNSVLSATTGSSASTIDVTAAVDAVLYADRAPERVWQSEQSTLSSQTSALDQIESEASSVADDLSALQDPLGVLSSVSASSSDGNILTASASGGTAASNHTVEVDSLATTGSWYSDEEPSSSTPLSTGSFTLTPSTGNAVTIDFGGSSANQTLDQVAASINTQSLGVTASVVTDSSGSRLSIVAQASGSAANFNISNSSGLGFTQVPGTDASLTVDGVPISSSTNTVAGAISGVTLNLQGASSGTTVLVSVAPDTSSISTAVNNFVSDYNTLISNVNSQFSYDRATGTAGTLQDDSVVQGFQSALLGSSNYSSGSGLYQTLTSLGVTTNADGTLSLDSTTLSNAVQNDASAVTSFFQGSASNGFVNSLQSSLNTYTDTSEGAFTLDLQSISGENTELTDETNTLELYLSTEQTTLTTQYNKADIALEELPQTLKQTETLLGENSSSNNNS